jgi:hypothetical protein
MDEDPFGGDEHAGWRCSRGHRNAAEQQTCGCGCGMLMVEGTMILRSEETGEEYEGPPRL